MRKVPFGESLRIIGQGSWNWFAQRPLVVSFEVTDACTCYCRHCDHGGPMDGSRNLKPQDYRKYMEELRPCVVQISGGEPLMRKDLDEIVRNIASDSGLPYLILVSNWSMMTKDRYVQLRRAGVSEFCVSLDFPDERHDEFRRFQGLFKHLSHLIPKLTAHGKKNIVMNTAITRWNLPHLEKCYDTAKQWGANISFSAYTAKRTGEADYDIKDPE